MSDAIARPLRRDAERNRQLILYAARELFEQRGLAVTLNDIAHHAGVGVATVYRHFPDKTALIDLLFEQKIEQLVAIAEAAIADPDPWHGLTSFFERLLEVQVEDAALRDLIFANPKTPARIRHIRERLLPLGEALIRRAQKSGQLRADIGPSDLPMLQLMLSRLVDGSRDIQPELWRRYLQIMLQGLRAQPVSPPPALRTPALGPEHVDAVMTASHLLGR